MRHLVNKLYGNKMKRKCPNCKNKNLQLCRLILTNNVKCTNCKSKIGNNPFFNMLYMFIGTLAFIFGAIYLVNNTQLHIALISIAIYWLSLGLLREIIVPLEVKE